MQSVLKRNLRSLLCHLVPACLGACYLICVLVSSFVKWEFHTHISVLWEVVEPKVKDRALELDCLEFEYRLCHLLTVASWEMLLNDQLHDVLMKIE